MRTALIHRLPADEVAELAGFYGFEPLPHRGPAVSNALSDRLRAEKLDSRGRAWRS